MIKEKYSPKGIAHTIYDIVSDYGALLKDFPSEVNEILYRIKTGKMVVDIELNDKAQMMREVKQFGNIIAMTILIGVMMIGAITMNMHGHGGHLPDIILGISLFFGVWLLLRLAVRLSS